MNTTLSYENYDFKELEYEAFFKVNFKFLLHSLLVIVIKNPM